MIVLYSSPGCASCRKVKAWLNNHNLMYIEKNIFNTVLSKTEVKYLLLRTENGSDDIISKRSKVILNGHYDIDLMSTDELINFVIDNPSILRRPIIVSENFFQVGYDAEEIDALTKLTKLSDSREGLQV